MKTTKKNKPLTLLTLLSLALLTTQLPCQDENCTYCPKSENLCETCSIGYHTSSPSKTSTICEPNTKNCYKYDEEKKTCTICNYNHKMTKTDNITQKNYYCKFDEPPISKTLYIIFFLVILLSTFSYFFYIVLSSEEFKNWVKGRKRGEKGEVWEKEVRDEENKGSQRPLVDGEVRKDLDIGVVVVNSGGGGGGERKSGIGMRVYFLFFILNFFC